MSGRSLWPREHGAYAQLAAPLATALAIRTPTVATLLFSLAACAAFLVNEPLLVLRGHRGRRMREECGTYAARRLAFTTGVAAASGALALFLAPAAAVATALVVAVAAVTMFVLAWIRAERSWSGELVASIALPAAGAPVMVASGLGWRTALTIWLAWSIGYACSVIAVHRVIARHRKPAKWRDVGFTLALSAVTATALVAGLEFPPLLGGALLAAIATLVAARPPSARHLRPIGLALTVASITAGAVIVTCA